MCAGYEQVPEEEKAGRVKGVFLSVAPSYDLMNDLMSVGLHRLWKDRCATLTGGRKDRDTQLVGQALNLFKQYCLYVQSPIPGIRLDANTELYTDSFQNFQ